MVDHARQRHEAGISENASNLMPAAAQGRNQGERAALR
jgi:hypothetical protein